MSKKTTIKGDGLDHIRDRAAHIKQLVTDTKEQRELLRADLTAADRERQGQGREQLAAAAAGGLSRAKVMELLGDISGAARRLLKAHELTAEVTVQRDGIVRVEWVELDHLRVDSVRLDEDGEADPDAVERAEQADKLRLMNGVGGLLNDLRAKGITAWVGAGDPADAVLAKQPLYLSRAEES
ncbi:hypothetical protein ACGFX7_05985 [Streptomyces harbinensis]|uniref:hypothetical protein n=1 Tax=Streptomyces harbinensis TaxID=1176198 RepID=UPI00371F08F0